MRLSGIELERSLAKRIRELSSVVVVGTATIPFSSVDAAASELGSWYPAAWSRDHLLILICSLHSVCCSTSGPHIPIAAGLLPVRRANGQRQAIARIR